MEVRRGLTRSGGPVPALLAALVGLAAIGAFAATRSAAAKPHVAEAQAVASGQAAALSAQLQSDAALLGSLGDTVAGDASRDPVGASALAPSQPGAAIGVAAVAPGRVAVLRDVFPAGSGPGAALVGSDLGARPEWQLALALARDGGGTVAAASGSASGGFTLIEAQALYGAGSSPIDVDTRRARVTGYAVLLEPVGSISGLSPEEIGSHVRLRLVQDGVLLAGYGPAGSPGSGAPASASVTANGVNWTVEGWPIGHPSRLPWVVFFGGLLVAAVVGAVATVAERRGEALARQAAARAGELGLVARTATLLQQSLDVAELLPLFVVEVSDELGLENMTAWRVSETGVFTRYFSVGSTAGAGPDASVLADLPESVPPGGLVTIPLQRAGRIVGALTATAVRGLEPSQLDALRTVSDLLASAVGNARLFQQEQEMVVKLQELDRLKTVFLGSVSHELRTTVTAIEGFAGLLTTQSAVLDDERRADFINRIRRNARSLGVLVEDLLDFARMERGGLSMTVQPVRMEEHVPRVIEQMQSILGDRRVELTMTPGTVAAADPGAVERIMSNLLSNASKYTPQGTPVEVSVSQDDGHAVLSVSDHGPGIPVEERERVFDLFYRGDSEAARSARGVGIGLALVRQLVELLDGTITVGEAPGGGARFEVRLPLVGSAPGSPAARHSAAAGGAPAPAGPGSVTLSPPGATTPAGGGTSTIPAGGTASTTPATEPATPEPATPASATPESATPHPVTPR